MTYLLVFPGHGSVDAVSGNLLVRTSSVGYEFESWLTQLPQILCTPGVYFS